MEKLAIHWRNIAQANELRLKLLLEYDRKSIIHFSYKILHNFFSVGSEPSRLSMVKIRIRCLFYCKISESISTW